MSPRAASVGTRLSGGSRDAQEKEAHRGAVRLGHPRVVLSPEDEGEVAAQDVDAHEPRHRLVGIQPRGRQVARGDEGEHTERRPERDGGSGVPGGS